jgi:hypothetical protein
VHRKLGIVIGLLIALVAAGPAEANGTTTVRTTRVFTCADGRKKATYHTEGRRQPYPDDPNWWVTTREKVDNPCPGQWLVVWIDYEANSETNCCVTYNIPPGAHYDLKPKSGVIYGHISGGLTVTQQFAEGCDEYNGGYKRDTKGRIVGEADCPDPAN